MSLPGNTLTAKERIAELLKRAGTWLSTPAIIERTGCSTHHANAHLRELVEAGAAERRDDPENNRRAEWRAT